MPLFSQAIGPALNRIKIWQHLGLSVYLYAGFWRHGWESLSVTNLTSGGLRTRGWKEGKKLKKLLIERFVLSSLVSSGSKGHSHKCSQRENVFKSKNCLKIHVEKNTFLRSFISTERRGTAIYLHSDHPTSAASKWEEEKYPWKHWTNWN